MKKITYDKSRFKQIMVALDVYENLKSLKQSIRESFSDVIRGFLTLVKRKEEHTAWLVTKPVKEEVNQFGRVNCLIESF